MTFADRAIRFHHGLSYTGRPLPSGIRIMNPFAGPGNAMEIVETFFRKYFNDNRERCMILGINPGRFGAGLTGIPFTDPKRLVSECNIEYNGKVTHEPSSVFVYEVINAYGGADAFYRDFFINSPCPLGFTVVDANNREKNYNYYDSRELAEAVNDFMVESIHQFIGLGVRRDICFCLGTGKNEKFLNKLNEEHRFFEKIVPLEHPRFVMQYKSATKDRYVEKYVNALRSIQ